MASTLALTVAALALVAMGSVAAAAPFAGVQGSVTMKDGKATFHPNTLDKSATAFGAFDAASNNHSSNFGVLQIETNAKESDYDQYYAAGFLEGVLTQREIFEQYTNLASTRGDITPSPPANLSKFLDKQDKWMRSMVQDNQADRYWKQVGLVLAQFDGLIAGYQSVQPKGQELTPYSFEFLNGIGDLFDLVPATEPDQRPDFEKMTREELHDYIVNNGHCSALVKLTGDYSKLFMAHSSWFIYQSMLRIMKHYNIQASTSAAKKISFSSYPGFLESLDDFYIMDTGLVMLQTTNNVFNQSLYQYVVPHTLQAWVRVRVATALATDGEEWSRYCSMHNSGTYNNQYMVIDLNKFTPGKQLVPGTLWVSEQIPGTFMYADQTAQLERGYWPSYNVPFYEDVYNKSGYPSVVAKYGVRESYQLAPRAQIFRRDEGSVVDMDSFKAIMRYNDYKNDPYAMGDPMAAICSRGDLRDKPSLGGCYDTKVTEYADALKMRAEVINGPTTSHNLPPFSWAKFPDSSHDGMPTVFDFSFELMDPAWN